MEWQIQKMFVSIQVHFSPIWPTNTKSRTWAGSSKIPNNLYFVATIYLFYSTWDSLINFQFFSYEIKCLPRSDSYLLNIIFSIFNSFTERIYHSSQFLLFLPIQSSDLAARVISFLNCIISLVILLSLSYSGGRNKERQTLWISLVIPCNSKLPYLL